jgi:CxxC motif-containing protein (DUF1111 family)
MRAAKPIPIYGAQLQTRGVAGQVPEAAPDIAFNEKDGLRIVTVNPGKPSLVLWQRHAHLPARAPSLKGVGLLARVPDSEILKNADSEDANHDGIAGRLPWVVVDGKRVLGRFGWKAASASLPVQVAAAFSTRHGSIDSVTSGPMGRLYAR